MTKEDNTDLQENNNDDNITSSDLMGADGGNTQNDSADSGNTPNASDSAWQKLVDQQNSTIDVLLARTEQLTEQVNTLLRSGAQINDGNIQSTGNASSGMNDASITQDDDYIPLSDLGSEFGKA